MIDKVISYFKVFKTNQLLKELNNTLIRCIVDLEERLELANIDKDKDSNTIKKLRLKVDSQRKKISFLEKKLPNK
jgi:hypothetical protein